MTMINKNNFYTNTLGRFIECNIPSGEPDHISRTPWGDLSSAYYFSKEGVIRVSDHWGIVGSCQWNLNTVNERGFDHCRRSEIKAGYISFEELDNNLYLQRQIWQSIEAGDNTRRITLNYMLLNNL